MGYKQMNIVGQLPKTFLWVAVATLALSACSKREDILTGAREDLRPDLEAVAKATTVPRISLPATKNYASWSHKNGAASHGVGNPALGSALTRVWAQNIGSGNSKKNKLSADPIVVGGRIITLDSTAGLKAFSAAGALAWSTDLTPIWDKAGTASGGGLAYGAGLLVVTTGFGEVLAIDPATGGIKWRHRMAATISAAPVVIDNIAIAVSLDNKAVALNLSNGRIAWQLQSGGSSAGLTGAGAPAATSGFAVVPFASGEVIGVDTKTGARVWSAALTGGRKGIARGFVGAISGDPVIVGKTVYAANQAGRMISIDRETGARNWTANDGAYGPVWVAGGSVFLVTDNFDLKRVNATTGAELWSTSLPGYLKEGKRRRAAHVHYGPVLAGNRLVVASTDGFIRSFSPSSGALISTVALSGGAASQPAIVNGTLYILSGNGQIQAFR